MGSRATRVGVTDDGTSPHGRLLGGRWLAARFAYSFLAGAMGLEPDRGDFSNLLMARDFCHKSLRICCLVPVFDSPGVPSSPLESSTALERLWRRPAPTSDALNRLGFPSKADPPWLDDDQVPSDFLLTQGTECLQDFMVHLLSWKFVREADHNDPGVSPKREMKDVGEPDITREQCETVPFRTFEHL